MPGQSSSYLLLPILLLVSVQGYAFHFANLWLRPDQQAAKALQQGKPGVAAALFKDPHWRAIAQYRSQHYQQAVDSWQALSGERSLYNLGNALAYSGDYHQAIAAYDKALTLNPNNEDAKFNKALLEKLLNQQQQAQNQNNINQQQSAQKQSPKQQQQTQSQQQTQHRQQTQQSQSNQKKQQHSPQQNQQQLLASNNNQQSPQAKKQRQQHYKMRATKRWLNQIPDDPGGLLRQKFLRDYQRMQQNGAN